jgi:hypothetical protein
VEEDGPIEGQLRAAFLSPGLLGLEEALVMDSESISLLGPLLEDMACRTENAEHHNYRS